MQIGFILPSEAEAQTIERLRYEIEFFRPDQERYLEHLLRSWGIYRSTDGVSLLARGIKRTLRDRP